VVPFLRPVLFHFLVQGPHSSPSPVHTPLLNETKCFYSMFLLIRFSPVKSTGLFSCPRFSSPHIPLTPFFFGPFPQEYARLCPHPTPPPPPKSFSFLSRDRFNIQYAAPQPVLEYAFPPSRKFVFHFSPYLNTANWPLFFPSPNCGRRVPATLPEQFRMCALFWSPHYIDPLFFRPHFYSPTPCYFYFFPLFLSSFFSFVRDSLWIYT